MNSDKATAFKSILICQLKELQGLAGKTTTEMKNDEMIFPDPLDRAAADLDRDVELMIRNRDLYQIKAIREALSRIDHGTFGICKSCGESITEKRLRAKPTSCLCIQCKNKEERRQKSLFRRYAFA